MEYLASVWIPALSVSWLYEDSQGSPVRGPVCKGSMLQDQHQSEGFAACSFQGAAGPGSTQLMLRPSRVETLALTLIGLTRQPWLPMQSIPSVMEERSVNVYLFYCHFTEPLMRAQAWQWSRSAQTRRRQRRLSPAQPQMAARRRRRRTEP